MRCLKTILNIYFLPGTTLPLSWTGPPSLLSSFPPPLPPSLSSSFPFLLPSLPSSLPSFFFSLPLQQTPIVSEAFVGCSSAFQEDRTTGAGGHTHGKVATERSVTAPEATGCSQMKVWSHWDSPKLQGLSALDLNFCLSFNKTSIAMQREGKIKCPSNTCVMEIFHLDTALIDCAFKRGQPSSTPSD